MKYINKTTEIYSRYGFKEVCLRSSLKTLRSINHLLQIPLDFLESKISAPVLDENTRAWLQKNAKFKNMHSGKRCFIIANGPSLNAHDISILADELTFVASSFWKHPVVGSWQPNYYFFADPLFFDKNEATKTFFNNLNDKITNAEFFVPFNALERILNSHLLDNERVHPVYFENELKNGLLSSPDLTKPTPAVQNVMQLAIMTAMYMGCSPIYLLGMDHDWLSHRGEDKHFYTGGTIEGHAVDANRHNLSNWEYRSLMECVLKMWLGYEAIYKRCEVDEVEIFNLTPGGFLDVYERMEFSTVLKSGNK